MPSLLVSFAANEDRPRGFLIPLSSASQLVGLTPGLGVKLGTLGCGPECSTLGGGSSELQNSLTLPTFPPAFLGLGLGFFFFFLSGRRSVDKFGTWERMKILGNSLQANALTLLSSAGGNVSWVSAFPHEARTWDGLSHMMSRVSDGCWRPW